MFRTTISNTPFTSSVANSLFTNVNGNSYRGDYTFISTLRALVAPRMAENETLHLEFSTNAISLRNPEPTDIAYVVRDAVSSTPNNVIRVHDFRSTTPDYGSDWLELVQSEFGKHYSTWHLLEKVTLFFKKQFDVICFVEPEKKSVILFTSGMDMKRMHYLQCGIFAYLPWYFNPDEGVSELEMELINSLRERTSQKYEECLVKLAQKYDFKTANIRRLLSGFETRFEEIEIGKTKDSLSHAMSNIEELNRQIGEWLKEQRLLEIKLLGLETKIAQSNGDSEIMEYFMHNNNLVLESVDDTVMVFGVKTYLTYFDEEMARRVIDSGTSYVYRPRGRACNNIIPAEDMKKLMNAIFIDQTIRLRVCAAYQFRLEGNVSARSNFSYGYEYAGFTPNTHIDRYACIGNYERQINSFLSKNDYIGAIEQCVASCASLNFGDSVVMQEFMSRLYGISDYSVNIKCIELPDGSVVTPKEAIEYLKSEDSDNG